MRKKLKVLSFIIFVVSLLHFSMTVEADSPMYRLYNPNSGEHFYTASTNERDYLGNIGWKKEGVAWLAPSNGSPVYRLYNPNSGDHHYTLSTGERDMLVKVGWRYEGEAWYSGGSVPVYRLYNPNAVTGTHHYTLSSGETNSLASIGWRYEGTSWYAISDGQAYADANSYSPSNSASTAGKQEVGPNADGMVFVARDGEADVYWYRKENMPPNTNLSRVVTITEKEAVAAGKRHSETEKYR